MKSKATRFAWIRPALMVVFGIILVAATAAIAIPILSTPAETWGVVPFAAFGTIVAATVAALGALAVAQTYAERKADEISQRRWEVLQAIRARREETYSVLANHFISSFSDGGPTADLAGVRATSALWASREVLQSMTTWNRFVAELRPISTPGGPQPLQWHVPAARRAEVEEIVGQILSAMRHDLETPSEDGSTHPASAEEIAAMVFNDYDEAKALQ